jgi:pyruvate carboxylase
VTKEIPVTDPHQPGTPSGTDQGDIERRAAIAEVLGKEVWPAERDQLVAKAEEASASDTVLGQLRRLPGGQQFTNLQEVAEALGLGTEQQRF